MTGFPPEAAEWVLARASSEPVEQRPISAAGGPRVAVVPLGDGPSADPGVPERMSRTNPEENARILDGLGAIDRIRDRYASIVQRTVRYAALSLVAVVATAAAAYALYRIVPSGFLPEEDQGAFFVNVQLPAGASIPRTREVVQRVEALMHQLPQVEAKPDIPD